MINRSWALHAHGPASGLSALQAAWVSWVRPTLFSGWTNLELGADKVSLTYSGKATIGEAGIREHVVELSAAHPDLTLVTVAHESQVAGVTAVTSYRAGLVQGCSRSERYEGTAGGALVWLPPQGRSAYQLCTWGKTALVAVTGDGLFAALSEMVRCYGLRTVVSVVSHPGPGGPRCAPGLDVTAHRGLEVVDNPDSEVVANCPDPGFEVRLSMAAFAAARLDGFVNGLSRQAPFVYPVLGELLAACDDPDADPAALLHATYLSAAGARPLHTEHEAVGVLAALAAKGDLRLAVSALHEVMFRLCEQKGVWADDASDRIYAIAGALSAPAGRPAPCATTG